MFDKCLDDYYKNKSVKEICLKLGISQTTFNRKLREQNIPNRRSFLRLIDTGKTDYFMGFEEASRHYGLRGQSIGEAYAKTKYRIKGYDVEKIDYKEVLSHKDVSTLIEYYEKYIR